MLFDDLDDSTRQKAIAFLEASLFDRYTVGQHYFKDVTSTLPGFDVACRDAVPQYHVHVSPSLLKNHVG